MSVSKYILTGLSYSEGFIADHIAKKKNIPCLQYVDNTILVKKYNSNLIQQSVPLRNESSNNVFIAEQVGIITNHDPQLSKVESYKLYNCLYKRYKQIKKADILLVIISPINKANDSSSNTIISNDNIEITTQQEIAWTIERYIQICNLNNKKIRLYFYLTKKNEYYHARRVKIEDSSQYRYLLNGYLQKVSLSHELISSKYHQSVAIIGHNITCESGSKTEIRNAILNFFNISETIIDLKESKNAKKLKNLPENTINSSISIEANKKQNRSLSELERMEYLFSMESYINSNKHYGIIGEINKIFELTSDDINSLYHRLKHLGIDYDERLLLAGFQSLRNSQHKICDSVRSESSSVQDE